MTKVFKCKKCNAEVKNGRCKCIRPLSDNWYDTNAYTALLFGDYSSQVPTQLTVGKIIMKGEVRVEQGVHVLGIVMIVAVAVLMIVVTAGEVRTQVVVAINKEFGRRVVKMNTLGEKVLAIIVLIGLGALVTSVIIGIVAFPIMLLFNFAFSLFGIAYQLTFLQTFIGLICMGIIKNLLFGSSKKRED